MKNPPRNLFGEGGIAVDPHRQAEAGGVTDDYSPRWRQPSYWPDLQTGYSLIGAGGGNAWLGDGEACTRTVAPGWGVPLSAGCEGMYPPAGSSPDALDIGVVGDDVMPDCGAVVDGLVVDGGGDCIVLDGGVDCIVLDGGLVDMSVEDCGTVLSCVIGGVVLLGGSAGGSPSCVVLVVGVVVEAGSAVPVVVWATAVPLSARAVASARYFMRLSMISARNQRAPDP